MSDRHWQYDAERPVHRQQRHQLLAPKPVTACTTTADMYTFTGTALWQLQHKCVMLDVCNGPCQSQPHAFGGTNLHARRAAEHCRCPACMMHDAVDVTTHCPRIAHKSTAMRHRATHSLSLSSSQVKPLRKSPWMICGPTTSRTAVAVRPS